MAASARRRLETILELIELIDARLEDMDADTFAASRDEIDLTAFRLLHIGEESRNLPDELKRRHAHIDWRAMYAMRNLISHNYGAVRPIPVWEAARGDLDTLADVCRRELNGFSE
jgi:uncharacterized protein with HEPN domain|tara:strand:+ start:63764 stop:64108 length:345 start_codon:yes stop_codon:yes gene_type:complete